MYIFSNAMKNLLRNKGRYGLLAAIILVIVITTVVTLSITNTAEGIIADYRSRFGSQVTIGLSDEAIAEIMSQGRAALINMPQVTAQQSLAFAESQYLMDYIMTAQLGAGSVGLQAMSYDANDPMQMAGGRGGALAGGVAPTFRIMGNMWDDFESGQRILVDGEKPVSYGEALISVDLAEQNQLFIGDTVQFQSAFLTGDERIPRDVVLNLTITGLYIDTADDALGGFIVSPFADRRNEVLTTLETVISQLGVNESGVTISATYYLRNPAYLSNFEAELRAGGLNELFSVTTDVEAYNAIIQPVAGLQSVAFTFMFVVLILGGLVLILLSFIAIRERKYEIGVLRAMGMKKHKLVMGLWSEMFAVTVICLIIGLTAGIALAQPISDTLLAAQVENVRVNDNYTNSSFVGHGGFGNAAARLQSGMISGLGSNQAHSPLESMDLSIGITTILEIIGISLALTTAAALLAITRITKYEPIKILMERT